MALKPEDPSSGFWHGKVMAFINERMSRHAKGPEFYLENLSLSWEKVEDKFKAILEDRQVPGQAKEACAWGSLALGMRFACRQSQLHGHRVQWLHDLAGLHKSAAHALASDLKLFMAQHELECKEAAFQLQQMQANLEKTRKERDQLRWKLFQAVRLLGPCPASRLSPQSPVPAPALPPGQVSTLFTSSRSWSLCGNELPRGQVWPWPLPVGLRQKEPVKRKRRRHGPLLLLLRLLKPQEKKERRMRKGRELRGWRKLRRQQRRWL